VTVTTTSTRGGADAGTADAAVGDPAAGLAGGAGARRALRLATVAVVWAGRGVWRVVAHLWVPLLLLAAWQAWITFGDVAPIVMPSPWASLGNIASNPGRYFGEARITMVDATYGLVLGMAIGLVFAVAGWFTPFFSGLVTPVAMMLRSIPITAMIPVIARILGYNHKTTIAVAVLISIFPTFVFASSGLRTTPPGAADYFAVMHARRHARLLRLALPSALPNLFTALRISAGLCILGALVAEWLIGSGGLGYQLAITRIQFEIERMWGIAIVAATLSVLAFLGATRLERWATERWG
jgi:ABC-type nitrate/sulfonate/bicarbonate transport system permease component